MALVDEECHHPVIPNKKDYHRFEGEKSMGWPPILPIPGEVKHAVILGDSWGWNKVLWMGFSSLP